MTKICSFQWKQLPKEFRRVIYQMKKLESDLDESDEEEAVIDDDDETDFDVEPDLIAKSTG